MPNKCKLLVVIAMFLALLIACNRQGSTAASKNQVSMRILEDQIKRESAAAMVSSTTGTLSIIAEITDPALLPMPVAVLPESESKILVLDNNLSRLYEITIDDAKPRIQKLHLPEFVEYPVNMKMSADKLYIIIESALTIINPKRQEIDTIKNFYSAHDLAIYGTNIYLALNASNKPGFPVAIGIDNTGKRVSALFHEDFKQLVGLERKVSLASCDDTVVAGMFYSPYIYIFHPPNPIGRRVHLPVPGEQQLERLKHRPELTNPQLHVFALPTFFSGVACEDNSFFVLVDMPFPCIYQLDKNGKIIAIFSAPHSQEGRHFRDLAVQNFHGRVFFYLIGTDSDQSSRVFVIEKSQ